MNIVDKHYDLLGLEAIPRRTPYYIRVFVL